MLSRRQVLLGGSTFALLATQVGAVDSLSHAATLDNVDCGVASGDPTDQAITLWTRVPRYGRDKNSLFSDVTVIWEMASHPSFADHKLLQSGRIQTGPAQDFTVNVRIGNLRPNTVYFYRFRTSHGYISQIGQTKTFPAPDAHHVSGRFAVVSCQMYSAGHFTAFSHIAASEYDAIIHLGDAIYEYESGKVRKNQDPLDGRKAESLADFRLKHLLYLSDPNLQAARRSAPMICIWDDHEVANDYSGQVLSVSAVELVRGGYQAFTEYMPVSIRLDLKAERFEYQLFRQLQYGALVNFLALDGRQYRSEAACDRVFLARGCDNASDPNRTMLGPTQKEWLLHSLSRREAKWQVLLSDMVFSPLRASLFKKNDNEALVQAGYKALKQSAADNRLLEGHMTENKLGVWLSLDGWDGFSVEREEILTHIVDNGIENVVIFSGDIHASVAAKLYTRNGSFAAHEVVAPSISSVSVGDVVGGILGSGLEFMFKRYNENLTWQDLSSHGYVAFSVTPDKLVPSFYKVDCKKSNASAKLNHIYEIVG